MALWGDRTVSLLSSSRETQVCLPGVPSSTLLPSGEDGRTACKITVAWFPGPLHQGIALGLGMETVMTGDALQAAAFPQSPGLLVIMPGDQSPPVFNPSSSTTTHHHVRVPRKALCMAIFFFNK